MPVRNRFYVSKEKLSLIPPVLKVIVCFCVSVSVYVAKRVKKENKTEQTKQTHIQLHVGYGDPLSV